MILSMWNGFFNILFRFTFYIFILYFIFPFIFFCICFVIFLYLAIFCFCSLRIWLVFDNTMRHYIICDIILYINPCLNKGSYTVKGRGPFTSSFLPRNKELTLLHCWWINRGLVLMFLLSIQRSLLVFCSTNYSASIYLIYNICWSDFLPWTLYFRYKGEYKHVPVLELVSSLVPIGPLMDNADPPAEVKPVPEPIKQNTQDNVVKSCRYDDIKDFYFDNLTLVPGDLIVSICYLTNPFI